MAGEADESRHHRVELLGAILLALAAVATAWSSYQSTRWRGEQTAEYSKASATRIESSSAETRAGQLMQIDIATFVQWVNANVAGNADLATFYRRRFRPEFKPAFYAWVATHPRTNPKAPLSPFAMPQYRVAEAVRAEQLNREAGKHAARAGVLNDRSNDFVLAVVLFATTLFFAAMSARLRSTLARELVLGLGLLIFLGTVAWLATFPVSI